MTDTQNELVVLQRSVSIILTADENDILGALSKKLARFHADVSTPGGRREIASIAAEVASAKMNLIRLGKRLTEGWRKSTSAVNAECNLIEARMNEMKDRVRLPLTEFENAEKARVADHEDALERVGDLLKFDYEPSSDEISQRIILLNNTPKRDWQEFSQRAYNEISYVRDKLSSMKAVAVDRENNEARMKLAAEEERERQRLAAIKQQEEREIRIAEEAANRARVEADHRAKIEFLKFERKIREEKERSARLEAERLEKLERRVSDESHRAAVLKKVADGIALSLEAGASLEIRGLAEKIAMDISLGSVPHCRIEF